MPLAPLDLRVPVFCQATCERLRNCDTEAGNVGMFILYHFGSRFGG